MKSLFGFFLLVIWAVPVFAQNDPNEPVLPDIAPREVEIRGQLEIEFPTLERQPLIGFNPPPRVVEIPAAHHPFVEPYQQALTGLGQSPLAKPDPPSVSDLANQPPLGGEFLAGAGRYLTRFIEGRAGVPLSRTTMFYGNLDYKGTDGHWPDDELEDLRAPYDLFQVQAGLRTNFEGISGGLDVDGFVDQYALYGARLSSPQFDIIDQPDRFGQHAGAALWLETGNRETVSFQTRIAYGGTAFETDVVEDEDPEDEFKRSERRLSLNGRLSAPTGNGVGSLEINHAQSGIDTEGFLGNSVNSTDLSGTYNFRYQNQFDLNLGLRIMTFAANGDNRPFLSEDELETDTSSDRSTYFAPEFQISFYPNYSVKLYFQNLPGIEENSLRTLFEDNPFLIHEPSIQPTIRTLNAEAGADFSLGLARLGARIGFQRMPNFLFFEHAINRDIRYYRQGFSAARYSEARVLYAGATASVVLPAGFQATLRGTLRNGRLTEFDTPIPYFGPVTGQVMLSYSFAQRRGLIQMIGNYESARFRDREKTRKIGDFVNLDFSASYYLTPTIAITSRLENLNTGYLEQWDNYSLAPTILTVGLGVRW